MRTLIFLALTTACTPVGVPAARVSHPDSVAFPSGVFGATSTVDLVLTNSGAAESEVSAAIEPPFSVPSATFRVPAQGSMVIPLAYTPSSYDTADATLTLVVDAAARAIAVQGLVLTDADGDGVDAVGAGGLDCDDRSANVHPTADEFCNDTDDDCDGVVDESALDVFETWVDGDGDGFGAGESALVCDLPSGSAAVDGDCDDSTATIAPDVAEVFYDGVDADCLGDSDFDADGDGFDSADHGGLDCDDVSASIHPDVVDVPYDGVDADCSGGSDFDADGDGVDAEAFGGTDCNDIEPRQAPGLVEVEDGLDQDCDVLVDEDFVLVGDWVVSEVMLRPTAQNGQWLELRNTSSATRDLVGLQLVGGESQVLGVNPVAAGERVVLCAHADVVENGGVNNCAAVLAPWPGDSVELRLRAALLDGVDASGWSLPTGAALELPAGEDEVSNDLEASWCTATTVYANSAMGTPGAAESCP
ncbi:MAG: hypothetical protein KC912_12650 [Proteobacteria bacterium]|nr:hypothetical protein [Pseudomonadota bacterium]